MSTWFLDSELSTCLKLFLYVKSICMCTCPPLRVLITSGVMWYNMDPVWLVKLYIILAADKVDSHGLSSTACHERLAKKTKWRRQTQRVSSTFWWSFFSPLSKDHTITVEEKLYCTFIHHYYEIHLSRVDVCSLDDVKIAKTVDCPLFEEFFYII